MRDDYFAVPAERLKKLRSVLTVVGATRSLTGAFAATGTIHKIAGEEYADRITTGLACLIGT